MRPGLSDREIDELLAPAGIVLPPDLRELWRWHDGADPDVGAYVVPSYEFWPLERAVVETSLVYRSRDEVEPPGPVSPDELEIPVWPRDRFAVFTTSWGGGLLGQQTQLEPSPMWIYEPETWDLAAESPSRPTFASLLTTFRRCYELRMITADSQDGLPLWVRPHGTHTWLTVP